MSPLSPEAFVPKIPYGYTRAFNFPFGTTLTMVEAALKTEGFGVLFQLDLKEKFKEKLGVDFTKYMVLGVCIPRLAYKGLQEEIGLGLLLPCNVILFEKDRHTMVSAIDAVKMLSIVGRPEMREMAEEVNDRLKRVIDRL
jgi:uncharacterized protein (DUF302 family)